jgi:hypothetical protein
MLGQRVATDGWTILDRYGLDVLCGEDERGGMAGIFWPRASVVLVVRDEALQKEGATAGLGIRPIDPG